MSPISQVNQPRRIELISVEGRVIAMSHSLRRQVLFIKLESSDGVKHNIMVQHIWQMIKFPFSINIGARYKFKRLMKGFIGVGSYEVPLLITSYKSKAIAITTEQCDLPPSPFGLVSYKGRVSGIIDKDAGIYELDNRIHLITTYLNELTAELSSGCMRVVREADSRGKGLRAVDDDAYLALTQRLGEPIQYREINVESCLKKGDEVEVVYAHAKRQDGCPQLICCGQSRVINQSQRLFRKSENVIEWISHAILKYSPGVSSIDWLLSLQSEALESVTPNILSQNQVIQRWDNDDADSDSILVRLLKAAENHELLKKDPRYFTHEFLMPHHTCPAIKTLDPKFELKTIRSLKSCPMEEIKEEPQNSTDDSVDNNNGVQNIEDFWKCKMSTDSKTSQVIIGKLILENGIVKLQQEDQCMDIKPIVPGSSFKVGSVVALFGCKYITEEFSITEGNNTNIIHKDYIMTEDVVTLVPANTHEEDPTSNYKIRILLKSPLIYSCANMNKPSLEDIKNETFFMVKAEIVRTDDNDREVEKYEKFIRFSGQLADLCYSIEEGDLLKVECANIANVLKRTHHNKFLGYLSGLTGPLACVYLPEDAVISTVSSNRFQYDKFDVREVLTRSDRCKDLISVVGIIKSKWYMTSKFDSEIIKVDADIGTPGSKVISLLLKDQKEQDKEVWVFLRGVVARNFVLEYTKGIMPGIKVVVTSCKRRMSKETGNYYIYGSVITRILPLTIPQSKPVIPTPPILRIFASDCDNNEPFMTFANISQIVEIMIKPMCSVCDSEIKDSKCSYVGCQAHKPLITANAQILVNDGPESIMVFVKKLRQIEDILMLSSSERKELGSHILINCKSFNYILTNKRKRENKGVKAPKQTSDLTDLENKLTQRICNEIYLLRPLRFILCKMDAKLFKNRMRSFQCLDISELRPRISRCD